MSEKTSRLLSAPPCPTCAAPLDGVTSFSGATPSVGDATICIYCRSVLEFTRNFGLRAVPQEEFSTWPSEVRMEIQSVLGALKSLPKRNPPQRVKS